MARELAEFTRTARALQEIPLAHMVEAGALGVIEAQRELDRRMIDILREMGDPANGLTLGGRRRSLLELGLAPTFYQFTEATFTFIIDITVQESEEFSITLGLGGSVGDPALAGRSSASAPGAGASSAASRPGGAPSSSSAAASSASSARGTSSASSAGSASSAAATPSSSAAAASSSRASSSAAATPSSRGSSSAAAT